MNGHVFFHDPRNKWVTRAIGLGIADRNGLMVRGESKIIGKDTSR